MLRGAALVVASMSVVSCAGLGAGGLDSLACPELAHGAMSANFTGEAKANATIRAFVQASGDLEQLAARAEAEVGAACERMGHDLGVSDMGSDTKSKCGAVSAKIDAILQAAGHASLKASFQPPECHANATATAECHGQCNAHLDPGQVVANCEPAQLSGHCEGTCSGGCDGSCHGDCEGECSAKGANGKCAGHCKGTCHGHCDATCHAKCEGQWKAPHCQADVKAPTAEAKCNGSCKAHADLEAQCTEPKVTVHASAGGAELHKLVATLEANLPVLVRAEFAYGKRIAGDIEALVHIGGELPNMMAKAGAHAAACIGASASAVVHAQASISVSVQASASVSGKAGAHGG
jgi:hypothetical protein